MNFAKPTNLFLLNKTFLDFFPLRKRAKDLFTFHLGSSLSNALKLSSMRHSDKLNLFYDVSTAINMRYRLK